jgi:hypothetical protein
MAYLQTKLDTLTGNLKALKNVSVILFVFATAAEQGQMIYESLKKVKGMVKDIDDQILTDLYNKIFGAFLSGIPHQQIRTDDYFAFLQRLGPLLDEDTAKANETDAALREMLELAML